VRKPPKQNKTKHPERVETVTSRVSEGELLMNLLNIITVEDVLENKWVNFGEINYQNILFNRMKKIIHVYFDKSIIKVRMLLLVSSPF
jgi:hypothetical protein